jgi:glycosyltransferase involved in cell wall biosynthesis
MALGVPMVVSDTRTNKYYFNESVVRFCRGGNAEDFAQSILAVYQNKQATSRMVHAASELVRGYEWDVQKLIYLKLVDSLTQPSKKIQRPRSEPIL